MTTDIVSNIEWQSFSFKEFLFFVGSVIATFVSANNNLKPLHKTGIIAIFFVAALIYPLLKNNVLSTSFIIYGILFVIFSFFIYYISAKSDFRNRKRIDKEIINFTKQADTKKEIDMFGGDLDFFGDVDDDSIQKNEQYKQLVNLKFRKIKILCLKPSTSKDELRIGFLPKNFGNNIKIKFFDELNCENCPEEVRKTNDCSVENIKNTDKKQFHRKQPFCKNPCNNPDLSIRGRIITKSSNAADSVSVTIKYESGKKYIFKKYNSEDKECSLYLMLWEVWWNKCSEYLNIQNKCREEYEKFSQNKILCPNNKT